MAAFITRRSQLQWLASLAVAVLLPTASLLWFMSRVIANERLVVQQTAALYQDKLADATARTDSLFKSRLGTLDKTSQPTNHYSLFRRLVLDDHFQGLVVWQEDGTVAYPISTGVMGNDVSPDSPLAAAWHEEFANRQFSEAVELYDRFTTATDPRVASAALTGKSRCLSRLGKFDDAITTCQKAAFGIPLDNAKPDLRLNVENARLLLLSLLNQSAKPQPQTELFHRAIDALMADLYYPHGEHAWLSANQNLFIAQKVLEALQGPIHFEDAKAKRQLEQLAAAEDLSVSAAETLHPFANVFDGFFKTTLGDQPLYGMRHRTESSMLLVLSSEENIAPVLAGYRDVFTGSESSYRILDATGEFVAGTPQPQGKPYTVAALPDGFPGWKVELYFEGGDVFEKAAHRQIAVYIWTGVLVILLILIAAGFATRAVGRQIRLNSMKNDFIATVSHELKTPLASMRVLVDTLLEGHVRDEAQAKEYLRLTARENERLSRMIDNFLTFSRMERNKKAFTLAEASPAAIVADAVESIQTKYTANGCQLTVEAAKDLPEIQADHDAVVTVLVNLLDNACKYSPDHKQIVLKAFPGDHCVCFAVSDQGIGLARRHHRKIFDSFYQVDSSLARKAEGCGLGLSIVKFIVDAHKGTIDVESKPGEGSTFTVRLPLGQKNGD